MATRYIDKEFGVNSTTAIANDTTGTRKLQNLPDAGGIAIDVVDGVLKYNALGTIRTAGSIGPGATLTPTAAVALTAGQSGTSVQLNAAAGFAITLPAPAAGLQFRFTVAAAFATTNFTVVTSGSANIIFGGAIVAGDDVPADAEDSINFVATAELPGDFVEVWSDGTNWFAFGRGTTAGSITFTAA